jgi:hypothetical protein
MFAKLTTALSKSYSQRENPTDLQEIVNQGPLFTADLLNDESKHSHDFVSA